MKQSETKKIPKNAEKFKCIECNFICSKHSNYKQHLLTAKHRKNVNETTEPFENATNIQRVFMCNTCNIQFKSRTSLWRHKKSCSHLEHSNMELSTSNQDDTDNKDLLILELLKQNSEFQKLMAKETSELRNIITEQNQKMMEMAGNMGNNNNNINSNNKFNLNVFLNEKCKDAMSLTDFVKSLEITMDDFIQTGELGFVDGLSRVMIERINDMDLYNRPIHCTDLKRETLYIKDAEKWEKDANKEQLRKAVKGVAYKNDRMRPIWYSETPEVDILGSANCDKFLKYSQSALGGCGKEETKSFEDKIMKNIMKQVTIDKENH
jgi:hypothetical protein